MWPNSCANVVGPMSCGPRLMLCRRDAANLERDAELVLAIHDMPGIFHRFLEGPEEVVAFDIRVYSNSHDPEPRAGMLNPHERRRRDSVGLLMDASKEGALTLPEGGFQLCPGQCRVDPRDP